MLNATDLSGVFTVANVADLWWDDGRDLLFYTTTDGNLRSWNPNTDSIVDDIAIGGTLAGIGFTPDGNRVYVGQRDVVDLGSERFQITIHEVNLTSGNVTDFTFAGDLFERGTFDVAVSNTGIGLFTTSLNGSGWNPFRQIDISNNSISARTDFPSFPPSQITGGSFLKESEDRSFILIQENNISSGPLYLYDAQTDAFVAETDFFELKNEGFGTGSDFNLGFADISVNANLIVNATRFTFLVLDFQLDGVVDLDFYQDAGAIGGVAFSADGSKLYALDAAVDAIAVFDTSTWSIIDAYAIQSDVPLDGRSQIHGSIFVDDADRIVVVDTQDGYEVVDLTFTTPPMKSGTSGRDRLYGTAGNDIIFGLGNHDLIAGLGGNDTIDGGHSNDSIDGGPGFDFASYITSVSGVIVDLKTPANNTGIAFRDSYRSIEGIIGSDYDDTISGDDNSNRLKGRDGNDTLFVGLGQDTLIGSQGFDSFVVENITDLSPAGDFIVDFEQLDEIDFSQLTGLTYIGTSAFTGLAGEIRIQLSGGQTSFEIDDNGDLAVDLRLVVENGEFNFLETNSGSLLFQIPRNLVGGSVDDVIHGSAFDDILDGGAGDDTIIGNAGDDSLSGSTGSDIFKFNDLSDLSAAGDHITDFDQFDLLDFSAIGGLVFIGTAAFTGVAGEMRYSKGAGTTTIEIDSDGDQTPEHFLTIDNGEFDFGGTRSAALILQTNLDITGTAGNDRLTGGPLSDFLRGKDGHDSIAGSLDNDTLTGGRGFDTLSGEQGDDSLHGGSLRDTIHGGDGNDTIDGGDGDDLIWAEADDDLVYGGDGDDSIFGYFGADSLLGQAGLDTLDGGWGNDTIKGGADNDTLKGGNDNDTVEGNAGNDILEGNDGDDSLIGGTGNDTLVGFKGFDTLFGGSGADILVGLGQHDSVDGAGGNDLIFLGYGTDTAFGGIGNDTISGLNGTDHMSGDAGNDELNGEQGNDTLVGGADADNLNGGTENDLYLWNAGDGRDSIFDPSGTDTIRTTSTSFEGLSQTFGPGSGIEAIEHDAGSAFDIVGSAANENWTFTGLNLTTVGVISGGGGNDTLDGTTGDDHLQGKTGADLLVGRQGNDTIVGGAGGDLLIGMGQHDSIEGGGGDDLIFLGYGTDTAIGGTGNDTINGLNGTDDISGNAGADVLRGEQGADTITGGNGNDFLIGGTETDLFRFDPDDGNDTITDFEDGIDRMEISGGLVIGDLTIAQAGADTTIDFGVAGTTFITLINTQASNIDAGDFIFV